MAPDIRIGYVHSGHVTQAFHHSIAVAIAEDRKRHLAGEITGSPENIAESRCDVVQQFLDDYREPWLWFIDTDIVFSPDTHLRLLEAADPKERPIMSAMYYSQWQGRDGSEVAPVWATWRDDELKPVKAVLEGRTIVRIAAVGMGCCLVHRRVLETVGERFKVDPWPWFSHEVIETPKGNRRLGEDYTFCMRALECGFPIHGVTHVVGHRKTVQLDDTWVREAVAA